MHIALYQPQVPGNTGAIGRTCVGLAAELHLIGPCAFDLSDKAVRRAGLDYWPHLVWTLHDGPDAFVAWLGARQPWLVTKHGRLRYDQADYEADAVIVLGNEVRGLPEAWLERWRERTVAVPMLGPVRSFNLACTAMTVAVEARRRSGGFNGCAMPVINRCD
ncbi:MAG: tRNA (cytidine(34)-2'-O)-methyltransferase [Planctomycetes bacterium]|nr:tRNA (cytidine(34)-2'-O)-methyltransferase [Planctomycetota bacterium]